MPFVTPWGGYVILDDITHDYVNPESKKLEKRGNGLQPLQVALGSQCSYDPGLPNYREQVVRGVAQGRKHNEPGGMYWIEDPVWRVVSNRFNSVDWERFLSHYAKHVNVAMGPNGNRMLWYEPDLSDIEIRDYEDIHFEFPVNVLDRIINEKVLLNNTLSIFDEALLNSRVNKPDQPVMSADQKAKFLLGFEKRNTKKVATSSSK